jgi:hypothetical protein
LSRTAAQNWQEGLALLTEIEASQHPEPALLTEAASRLMASVEQDPSQVQPYLGLAWLAALQGDLELAHAYLDHAEACAPDFPPLLALRQRLDQAASSSSQSSGEN